MFVVLFWFVLVLFKVRGFSKVFEDKNNLMLIVLR